MNKTDGRRSALKWGLPLLLCAALYLIPLCFVSPVYRLNDDLQIRDILCGAVSGTPDMHTVYMRAPLSALLSGLYRLFPSVAWFGLFQCACIVLCSFIILRRFMEWLDHSPAVAVCGIILFTFLYLLFLRQFYLMPHYTLTAAVCGATALLCMLCPVELKRGDALRIVVLLLLCDQIRSQVFMLVLPHAALAFAYLLFTQKLSVKPALKVLASFTLCFGLLYALHLAAYAGPEWQEYLAINKSRTQLYDYSGVWESDEAKAYYAQYGIDENAYPLLKNYALLPLSDLRAERMSALAAWREPGRALSGLPHVKAVLWELRSHMFGASDAPYNIFFFALYIFAAIRCLKPGRRRGLLLLICGILLHLALYAYLLRNGRVPERVTLSLYLTQLTLPLALFVAPGRKHPAGAYLVSILLLVAACVMQSGDGGLETQNTVNERQDVVYSYMAGQPDKLFLLDTYACVDRTEPVFKAQGASNALLLGGWLYGSTLVEQKLELFGFESREQLIESGGAFLITRRGAGVSMEELMAYMYNRHPQGAQLMPVTMLASYEDVFLIYRLDERDN